VLNGVLKGEDTTLALGLITDVAVLVTHTELQNKPRSERMSKRPQVQVSVTR
jgi:hypothetical protein